MEIQNPQSAVQNSGPRRLAAALFVLFAGLYLLTARGSRMSVDDVPRYRLTHALLTSGTLEIPTSIMASPTTVDDRVYSKYGIGMSLAMAPMWLAGKAMAKVVPRGLEPVLKKPRVFAMSTTNQWLGALAVALLFLIARRMGFRNRTALLVALATGLASMLWLNAQTSFENVLVVVLIETVVLALIGKGRLGWMAAALAGMAMGAIFLTRWGDGWILLPGAMALLAGRFGQLDGGSDAETHPVAPEEIDSPWREGRKFIVTAAAFALPLLVGIGLAMAYNYARFFDPFEMGYDDDNVAWRFFHRGLFGFLFSPAKSVFVFTPLLVVAVAGLPALWRRLGGGLRSLGLFWLILAPLVVYSMFETWDGGWCFGPRYLLPSVVLAMLALGDWIEDERWGRGIVRPALFTALLAVGIYAQWICVTSDFNEYSDNYYVFRHDPQACPLWVCAKGFSMPRENLWFWKVATSPKVGPRSRLIVFAPLVILGVGILALRRQWMAIGRDVAGRIRQEQPAIAALVLTAAAAVALLSIVSKIKAGRPVAPAARQGFGLKTHYFPNARWSPPMSLSGTDRLVKFDWSGKRRPFPGDFSIIWEGQIEAPAGGRYLFGLDACGTATLSVAGRELIVNGSPQRGRRLILRSVELSEGLHPIRIRFASSPALDRQEINGQIYARRRHLPTGLTLRWKPPGALFLRTVPAHALLQPR